jgi:hypothetical protein
MITWHGERPDGLGGGAYICRRAANAKGIWQDLVDSSGFAGAIKASSASSVVCVARRRRKPAR